MADAGALPLRALSWFHGTYAETASVIAREGFREQFRLEDGEMGCSGGNLGTGIYVTTDWRTAVLFGRALLRVSFRPGTRILDARVLPDRRQLASLRREFGRDILRAPPWKVLPRNKKLTRAEVATIVRHLYREAWGRPTSWRDIDRKRDAACELLWSYRSLLLRYGWHGYGAPGDENGVVVFAGDRVLLEEQVADVPMRAWLEHASGGDPGALPGLAHIRRHTRRA